MVYNDVSGVLAFADIFSCSEVDMKKLIFSLLIFVLICGIMPAASAESIDLDGFTVTLPANFVAELKETEPGEGTEFFTAASAYQAESVYEMLTVQIGANSGLDTVFSEDFGFARREDLDLSLLTEDQLHAEAERFTAYLDSAFPVYMTYQSPKSIEADGRLGLVVTGYYTDYNNSLTGEFRAYEFYYLNKTIIIYYDTQIEGTYFNEAVFELSDGIVSNITFDMDPASQPMNAQRFSAAVSMAIPVLVTLAIALILGFLFGKIKRAPKPEETTEAAAPAAPAEAAPVKPAPAETAPSPQPKPPVRQPAPILADDTEDEAVDWQSMLAELKQQAANEPEAEGGTKPEVPVPETPQIKPDALQKSKAKPDSEPQTDKIDDGSDLKDNIESSFKEIGRLAAMIKEKLHLGKSEDEAPAENTAEPSEEISAEDTDYVSYLDKLLPKGRYKAQSAQKAPPKPEQAETPESAAVPAGPVSESQNCRTAE